MRLTLVTMIGVLLLLQYKLWIGDGGMVDVIQLQRQVKVKQDTLKQAKERNLALRAEVLDLQKGLDAIEERSRRDLGFVKRGESFFQLVDRHSN